MSAPAYPQPRFLLACDFLRKYAAALARGLADAGADVRLLTRDHALEFGGDVSAMRSEIRQRLDPSVPVWWMPGRVSEATAVGHTARLGLWRRHFAPQVVHLQEGVSNDPRLLLAAWPGPGRYALTVHDPSLHPGDTEPSRLRTGAEAMVRRGAGLIFVHSESLRAELLERREIRAPVEVVPHGIDAPAVRPPPATPTLLFFGRISPYKGVEVLLDAMCRVWASLPKARLVLAGEGQLPDHPVVHDPRVELLSRHVHEDEVPDLFARSACVVLPYRQAAQSGVGSLAKRHARPLVVSAVGGLPELVADGSGLIVPPGCAEALANALLELLRDPRRAIVMGRAGARTAADTASWTSVARRTVDAYHRHGLLP